MATFACMRGRQKDQQFKGTLASIPSLNETETSLNYRPSSRALGLHRENRTAHLGHSTNTTTSLFGELWGFFSLFWFAFRWDFAALARVLSGLLGAMGFLGSWGYLYPHP